ncbi:Adrenodoxin, mitochondrial [Perkinsus chesapeaki]|uniref:Adrenodoxin, mitochondrial n=1 Tax=Perkinsus chesapeaki TaxID=330153 RepID=A0A7J6MVV3_PERCH|nr:Adrenodoxin, mitochondrial [Perkinsus chesapeaki]
MSSSLMRAMAAPIAASSALRGSIAAVAAGPLGGRFARSFHADANAAKGLPTVNITFVNTDGTKKVAKAPIGWSLLKVAHLNDIDLEGASFRSRWLARRATVYYLKISTIVYLNPVKKRKICWTLPLGWRILAGSVVKVTEDMDGQEVKLPPSTVNFYVDGYKPTPD